MTTAISVRIKKELAERQPSKEVHLKRSGKKRRDSSPQPKSSELKTGGMSEIGPWEISVKQKFLMVLLGLFTIIGMQLFRGYFQDLIFLIVLAIFSLGLITAFLQRPIPGKQKLLLSLSTEMLYLSGVGYLGCVALQGTLLYQPLVVSTAFAACVMAPTLIKRLTSKTTDPEVATTDFYYLNRAFALLTVLPPTLIGLLVYADQLPINYLLVFISLMVSSPLLRQLPRRGSAVPAPIESAWLSPLSSSIFVLIFIALQTTR